MGVKGLTSLIENHPEFCENYRLHSTRVVIDAAGLLYYLYFSSNIDSHHYGGEYLTFSHLFHDFTTNLLRCQVEPYFIFDGTLDLDDKKLETVKERAVDKINKVKRILQGSGGNVLPFMAEGAALKVLSELGVPYAKTDFEADREVVILANSWKCPVIGKDSDFYIMNIHDGYIPMDSIFWDSPAPLGRGHKQHHRGPTYFLNCQRYHVQRFCRYYRVHPDVLPLFASVAGNDYVSPQSLGGFFQSFGGKRQRADGPPPKADSGHMRLVNILHALSEFDNFESAFTRVIQTTHKNEKDKVAQALEKSCNMYFVRGIKCSLKLHFEGKEVIEESLLYNAGLPAWFVAQHRRGNVPPVCLNAYLKQRHIMSPQVEDLRQPAATDCSHRIRQVMYGLMLKDKQAESRHDNRGQSKTIKVEVFSRSGHSMRTSHVEPRYHVDHYGEVPSLNQISSMSATQKVDLLVSIMDARNLDLTSLPVTFHLAAIATNYWVKHKDLQVAQSHYYALLLGWVYGIILKVTDKRWQGIRFIPDPLQEWGQHETEALRENFGRILSGGRPPRDITAVHLYQQWLSLLRYATHFNNLFQRVLPDCDLAIFYNGGLVHKLYCCLRDMPFNHHESWIKDNCFPRASQAFGFFDLLKNYVVENTPVSVRGGSSQIRGGMQNRGRGQRRGRGRGNGRGGHGRGGRGYRR